MQTQQFDVVKFISQLQDAIIWCSYKISTTTNDNDLTESLWSLVDTAWLVAPKNNRIWNFQGPMPFKGNSDWNFRSDVSLKDVLRKIIDKRHDMINQHNLRPKKLVPNGLMGGRLVVYFPKLTLSDGAAQYSSNGFFNWDNVPAPDTWIYYHEDQPLTEHIIAWVPHKLISEVDKGIGANPEECISWVNKTGFFTPSYLSQLEAAELI